MISQSNPDRLITPPRQPPLISGGVPRSGRGGMLLGISHSALKKGSKKDKSRSATALVHPDMSKLTNENISEAISRAKKRDNPPCTTWPKKTGTTVYKLVEKLLSP